jgi:hypothetical protein
MGGHPIHHATHAGFWPQFDGSQKMAAATCSDQAVDRLIGAWNLVSWFETRPDGGIDHHLDDGWIGKLIYTADGHVSAQIVQKNLHRFIDEDYRNASAAESAAAWKGYFGYFGTFSVDPRQRSITHHIEGAWFPNLAGTDQVRRYRFEDSRLILEADSAWGHVGVIWTRAAAFLLP